jgi:hypothetical protein
LFLERYSRPVRLLVQALITITLANPIRFDNGAVRVDNLHKLSLGTTGERFALGVEAFFKIGAVVTDDGETPPAGGIGCIVNDQVPVSFSHIGVVAASASRMRKNTPGPIFQQDTEAIYKFPRSVLDSSFEVNQMAVR